MEEELYIQAKMKLSSTDEGKFNINIDDVINLPDIDDFKKDKELTVLYDSEEIKCVIKESIPYENSLKLILEKI